jgi:Mg/Co/Ni transporter MgtE
MSYPGRVGRRADGLSTWSRYARTSLLEVVLRYLRRFDELPDHTDQLFVVDRDEHLEGVLP